MNAAKTHFIHCTHTKQVLQAPRFILYIICYSYGIVNSLQWQYWERHYNFMLTCALCSIYWLDVAIDFSYCNFEQLYLIYTATICLLTWGHRKHSNSEANAPKLLKHSHKCISFVVHRAQCWLFSFKWKKKRKKKYFQHLNTRLLLLGR